MAKVEITPILADSIKTLRMQKGISSRGIASAIGRSPSYFSKIENGSIKSIDKSELDRIFDVITGDDRSLDKQIDSLYATLKIKYSAEEIKEDVKEKVSHAKEKIKEKIDEEKEKKHKA